MEILLRKIHLNILRPYNQKRILDIKKWETKLELVKTEDADPTHFSPPKD